jgi:hypothetical protein
LNIAVLGNALNQVAISLDGPGSHSAAYEELCPLKVKSGSRWLALKIEKNIPTKSMFTFNGLCCVVSQKIYIFVKCIFLFCSSGIKNSSRPIYSIKKVVIHYRTFHTGVPRPQHLHLSIIITRHATLPTSQYSMWRQKPWYPSEPPAQPKIRHSQYIASCGKHVCCKEWCLLGCYAVKTSNHTCIL